MHEILSLLPNFLFTTIILKGISGKCLRLRASTSVGFKRLRLTMFRLWVERMLPLGKMYRELTSKGIKIPNGFAVTAEAYWHTLKAGGILEKLKKAMEGLDIANVTDLAKRGKIARDLILGAGIPDDLWEEIKIGSEINLCCFLGKTQF